MSETIDKSAWGDGPWQDGRRPLATDRTSMRVLFDSPTDVGAVIEYRAARRRLVLSESAGLRLLDDDGITQSIVPWHRVRIVEWVSSDDGAGERV